MLQQYRSAKIKKCPFVYFNHVKMKGGCSDLKTWAKDVVSNSSFLDQYKDCVPHDLLQKMHKCASKMKDRGVDWNESLYMLCWRDLLADECLEIYRLRLQGCWDREQGRIRRLDDDDAFVVPTRDKVSSMESSAYDLQYAVDKVDPELYIGKRDGKKDFYLHCPVCDKLLPWKNKQSPPKCSGCTDEQKKKGKDFWARYPSGDELAEAKEIADDMNDFGFFGHDDKVMKFISESRNDFHVSSPGTTKWECNIVCRRCDALWPVSWLDKVERHMKMQCHLSKPEQPRPEKKWEHWKQAWGDIVWFGDISGSTQLGCFADLLAYGREVHPEQGICQLIDADQNVVLYCGEAKDDELETVFQMDSTKGCVFTGVTFHKTLGWMLKKNLKNKILGDCEMRFITNANAYRPCKVEI